MPNITQQLNIAHKKDEFSTLRRLAGKLIHKNKKK